MNKQHMALSLSVGVLGGISVFLAGNVLSSVYLIWVGFIAWGLFFKNGGDNNALKMTITAGIYGAVLAGLFFALSAAIVIGGALNAPIWIAITVFALIFGTQVPMFSCAPTAVCGYAATAGYVIHAADGAMAPMVTSIALTNPVVTIALSIIIGSIFGMISGKVAASLGS
tara:strand:- start:293 stop:802 length:510 start_codon:yes stop_codon:yes gene_type:complete